MELKELRAIVIHGLSDDTDFEDIDKAVNLETIHALCDENHWVKNKPWNTVVTHCSDKSHVEHIFQNRRDRSYLLADSESPDLYTIGIMIKNFESYKQVKKCIQDILTEFNVVLDKKGSKKAAKELFVPKPENGVLVLRHRDVSGKTCPSWTSSSDDENSGFNKWLEFIDKI